MEGGFARVETRHALSPRKTYQETNKWNKVLDGMLWDVKRAAMGNKIVCNAIDEICEVFGTTVETRHALSPY